MLGLEGVVASKPEFGFALDTFVGVTRLKPGSARLKYCKGVRFADP